MLANWVEKYPIISIEDGMAEGDWDGWKHLTERLGKNVQLVGDDLYVTNTKIFKEGIDKGIANSIPVSYTHLDVYKRQTEGWPVWERNFVVAPLMVIAMVYFIIPTIQTRFGRFIATGRFDRLPQSAQR